MLRACSPGGADGAASDDERALSGDHPYAEADDQTSADDAYLDDASS